MPKINLINPIPIQKDYPCPLCHHGKISQMVMMESFACNFCQHIFKINIARQTLDTMDTHLSLSWHWNGRGWRGDRASKTNLGILHMLFGLVFICLPTSTVALSNFIFPPLPGSPFAWVAPLWIISTFIAHCLCLVFLVIEYYQWPIGIYFEALKRKLVST